MPATSIQSPFPIFTDIDGQPLEQGQVWLGTAGNNPISSPITAYWDAALTQVVTQPVTTRGGYPLNGTAVGRLYVNADFSILVRNRRGYDVLSALSATERFDSSLVTFMQAGLGAVTRTAQAKMRDIVSVKDFGAVADGAFVAGGSASGTDNLLAFNAALAAAVSTGISRVYVPGGRYYLSGKLTLPGGVILEGDGTAWLPGFLAGISKGTALLINGSTANDCFAFSENTAHAELRDISIYNTNTNAIRSVVSVVGHLYPRMQNVEISSLRKTTGAGLYLSVSTAGAQYETLWGAFHNVTATCTEVGNPTEASVRWGLIIYAVGVSKVCNANAFWAGQFVGTWGGLLVDGATAGARNLSNVFHGTKFDTIWDGTFTPVFKSAAANVFGWLKNNCYIYPVVRLNYADGIVFHGCYFEAFGSPSTYNDGVNGSATLLAVIWMDNATECIRTGAIDCNFNATFVYYAGSQSNITPVTGGYKHNNQFNAAILLRQSTAQSIAPYAYTTVQFSNVLQGDDANLEWDSSTYKVKIRQPGVYQISGQVSFAGWSTAGTYATCRISGGGYNIFGTTAPQIGSGNFITTTANVALQLATGDTIELQVLQNEGNNQALEVNGSILSLVKIQ